MPSSSRKQPTKRFRLSAKMRSIADASADPVIQSTHKALEEFEYSEVVGTRYGWKYLSDEAFSSFYLRQGVDAYTLNRAVLSHLIRLMEAFEITSIWRAWELLDPLLASLNNEQLNAAATLSRSLMELTVAYGDAANFLRINFHGYPWEKAHTEFIGLDQRDNGGRRVGLESYIERLMHGTRIKALQGSSDMEQKNILSLIDKLDKQFAKQNHGYAVKPHYEFLCELAHPNTIGYQRFLTSVRNIGNGWTERMMEAKSMSEWYIHVSRECLWSVSFSTGSLNGLFGEFQSLKKNLVTRLGRILPT